MQLNYDFRMARGKEGFRTDAGRPHDVDSWHNPIRAQANTATFAGTPTDGNYTLTFGQLGANDLVAQIVRSTTPATVTDLAVAMRDLINTTRAFQNLVTATNAAGVLSLAFIHKGIVYTVEAAAPAPATLVVAQTAAPGGSFKRIGMMGAKDASIAGQDRRLADITTGTTAADIVGIVEGAHHLINGADFQLAYDAWQPGNEVPLGKSGRWEMRVIDAVTPASTVFMWNDETDPTGHPGQLAGSALGGGAITLASLPIQFLTSAGAGELATVQVGFGA